LISDFEFLFFFEFLSLSHGSIVYFSLNCNFNSFKERRYLKVQNGGISCICTQFDIFKDFCQWNRIFNILLGLNSDFSVFENFNWRYTVIDKKLGFYENLGFVSDQDRLWIDENERCKVVLFTIPLELSVNVSIVLVSQDHCLSLFPRTIFVVRYEYFSFLFWQGGVELISNMHSSIIF